MVEEVEDNYDTEITWSIVGGFLALVGLGVCIHYCCACRKRKVVEKEQEERLRLAQNESIAAEA